MPHSLGEEMTGLAHSQTFTNREDRYATREDFRKIFDGDLSGLYQLSLPLTGDHRKGESCFVAGIDDCARENRVFREWARAWAKRVIVTNAIRELTPRRKDSTSYSIPTFLTHNRQSSRPIGYFDVDAVLGLADFEGFVFVLCVLERYREHECALLLGCSVSEVREARTQAIEALARFRPSRSNRHQDRERIGWAEALKA